MRTKEQILQNYYQTNRGQPEDINSYLLEILLDIRDIINKKIEK